MDVVATVYGFVKKQMGTGRTLEKGECSLPPLQYATRAFWLDVGLTAKNRVEEEGLDLEVRDLQPYERFICVLTKGICLASEGDGNRSFNVDKRIGHGSTGIEVGQH